MVCCKVGYAIPKNMVVTTAGLRAEASPDACVLRPEVQNPVGEHQQGAVEPEPQVAGGVRIPAPLPLDAALDLAHCDAATCGARSGLRAAGSTSVSVTYTRNSTSRGVTFARSNPGAGNAGRCPAKLSLRSTAPSSSCRQSVVP